LFFEVDDKDINFVLFRIFVFTYAVKCLYIWLIGIGDKVATVNGLRSLFDMIEKVL